VDHEKEWIVCSGPYTEVDHELEWTMNRNEQRTGVDHERDHVLEWTTVVKSVLEKTGVKCGLE